MPVDDPGARTGRTAIGIRRRHSPAIDAFLGRTKQLPACGGDRPRRRVAGRSAAAYMSKFHAASMRQSVVRRRRR